MHGGRVRLPIVMNTAMRWRQSEASYVSISAPPERGRITAHAPPDRWLRGRQAGAARSSWVACMHAHGME